MLRVEEAERIVAEEFEAKGHMVLRVDLCLNHHAKLREWPALVVNCLGEPKEYDALDYSFLADESALRDWVRDHWRP